MKRSLNVEISGQSFTISSDAEENYILKVANYVNDKMQELSRASKPAAKSNVAMLTALNIADEYYRLKEAHEIILKRVNQLSKQVSARLSEEA
jgi:cell division protein ZapA